MAPRVGQIRNKPAGASDTTAKTAEKAVVTNGITVVTLKDGRRVGLRKLTPSQRFLLDNTVEAKTLSAGMQVKIIATVVSIDEEGWPAVAGMQDILDRLDELGDEGLQEITDVCLKMYGVDLEAWEREFAKN